MKLSRWTLMASALALLFTGTAQASMVMKMGLDDLVARSDKVFRGTVLSKEFSTVAAGGGEIPIVTYVLQVQDGLKGVGPSEGKVQVSMVSMAKVPTQTGQVQRLTNREMDIDMTVGNEYVLFTTQPSRIGLSTTVGLDQGLFRVFLDGSGAELIANGQNNQGLFQGPVDYDQISTAVRALVDK